MGGFVNGQGRKTSCSNFSNAGLCAVFPYQYFTVAEIETLVLSFILNIVLHTFL